MGFKQESLLVFINNIDPSTQNNKSLYIFSLFLTVIREVKNTWELSDHQKVLWRKWEI